MGGSQNEGKALNPSEGVTILTELCGLGTSLTHVEWRYVVKTSQLIIIY